MTRPCQQKHVFSPASCDYCRWCIEDSDKARRFRETHSIPHPRRSPLAAQILSFGRSVVLHAMNRCKLVPDHVARRRLEICEACTEGFDPLKRKCSFCGCWVDTKVSWATEKCPKDKWSAFVRESWCGDCAEGEIFPGIPDPLEPIDRATDPSWFARTATRDAYRRAFNRLLNIPIPSGTRSDGRRGIVYLGEGRYWHMLTLGVRMARHFTNLPIQVWHDPLLGPIDESALYGMENVEIIPIDAGKWWTRKRGGWENKTTALLRSGFSEVLFLDADAYLVGDPNPIFDAAKLKGIAYWRDFPSNESTIKWDWQPAVNGVRVGPIQGGQIAFNLDVWLRGMILAHWMNQHSDYFYKYQYGDQDSWRVVLAGMGQRGNDLGMCRFAYPAFWTDWYGPRVVHRAAKKIFAGGRVEWNQELPHERLIMSLNETQQQGDNSAASTFRRIYESGQWGPNLLSGNAEEPSVKIPYLALLMAIQAANGFSTCVDLGCGDGRLTVQLPFGGVGAVDVFDDHFKAIARRAPTVKLWKMDLDLDREQLPSAQVALLKDVLHHWPNKLVIDWLLWARKNGPWQWIIATQDYNQVSDSADCVLGGYRGLSPNKSPLSVLGGAVVGYCGHKVTMAFPGKFGKWPLKMAVMPQLADPPLPQGSPND